MSVRVRILLVEDSEFVAAAMEGVFAVFAEDASLQIVGSLAQAFAQLDDEVFDAIVLDLSLPDSEPHETLARVRQRVNDIPIVVVTGYSPKDVDRSLAADWIEKAATPLPEVVVRVLRAAAVARKAAHIADSELASLGRAIDNLRESASLPENGGAGS